MPLPKETRTYPNADARPHTGDRVRVDSEQTVRLSEDVTGTVRGAYTKRGTRRVRVMYGTRCGVHPFNIEAVPLLEASTPRFDDYDPDETENGSEGGA